MSDKPVSSAGGKKNALDCLPSGKQVLGVWAAAMTQLWDLSIEWMKLGLEQADVEEPGLGISSTIVGFPRPAVGTARVNVRCLRIEPVDGPVVPIDAVTLVPSSVDPGVGDADIEVRVACPSSAGPHFFRFVLTDAPAGATVSEGGKPAGTHRSYFRGFGV